MLQREQVASADGEKKAVSQEAFREFGLSGKKESQADQCGGRVLLLDDDVSFNQIITDFLTESGYTVVSVQGGADGIREVLAGDFSVILCDMVMPTLSGDMFYRAVERARPHLCSRFIFMTGHRCDPKINDFIGGIHAIGLRKPFRLDDLLCTMRLLQMCGRFTETSAFSSVAVALPAPLPSPILRAEENAALETVSTVVLAERRPCATANVTLPVPSLKRVAVGTDQEQGRKSSLLRIGRILVAGAILAVIPVSRYFFVVQRAAASSATLSLLQWESEHAAKLVQDGKEARRGLEELASVPERLAAERNSMKWTSALWIISGAARGGIELTGVDLRGAKDSAGICVLRVDGFATGKGPQTVADNFRAEIESKLRQQFEGRTTTARFERLDVESRSAHAVSEQHTVAFSIVVSINPVAVRQIASGKKL